VGALPQAQMPAAIVASKGFIHLMPAAADAQARSMRFTSMRVPQKPPP